MWPIFKKIRTKSFLKNWKLKCRIFFSLGRFVSWDVLSLGTFCPWDILSLGRFVPWDVLSWDVLSVHPSGIGIILNGMLGQLDSGNCETSIDIWHI